MTLGRRKVKSELWSGGDLQVVMSAIVEIHEVAHVQPQADGPEVTLDAEPGKNTPSGLVGTGTATLCAGAALDFLVCCGVGWQLRLRGGLSGMYTDQ